MVSEGVVPGRKCYGKAEVSERNVSRRRVTIADIALRAGVSKGAVSYALNDRPGISDATRRRILEIADELGWLPNIAARTLSGSKANSCGLVIARPPRTLAYEPFFMGLIAGIEAELSARSIALTLQVVDDISSEIAVHRRWWAERRVDGVLVVDVRLNDPRIDHLERIGLPAVILGGPDGTGKSSAVWTDDAGTCIELVRYLARLGHRRIARVAGLPDFLHTSIRSHAFSAVMSELSLEALEVTTDFLAESGAQATRQLLSHPSPPTAIIYDNDVLAVAGLGAAHEMGLSVPAEVSLIAWDDSPYCQVVHPALTAVARDISGYGARAVVALLSLIDGGAIVRKAEPRGKLWPRGSTGPAPGKISFGRALPVQRGST
jgi:DNA-binding LacI/PurR family transcriptional regulator